MARGLDSRLSIDHVAVEAPIEPPLADRLDHPRGGLGRSRRAPAARDQQLIRAAVNPGPGQARYAT